ncbi:hypothetical protein BpHYR1_053652 [Brachionus plicatilis]|uniref:Uncharacterized protein n=1 Tax=Brachionus plicatilis TaxID=10195 RepID=A0A3M7RTB1_BRAPC|nr:hypothetical protein BpHYR1_053652 [Brachionus plicatilis]
MIKVNSVKSKGGRKKFRINHRSNMFYCFKEKHYVLRVQVKMIIYLFVNYEQDGTWPNASTSSQSEFGLKF